MNLDAFRKPLPLQHTFPLVSGGFGLVGGRVGDNFSVESLPNGLAVCGRCCTALYSIDFCFLERIAANCTTDGSSIMWAHLQLCAVESNNLWIHTKPGSSTNCWPETMGTFLLPYYQWPLNWLQPHPIFLSKYTQNLVDVPLPCVFLWKLSARNIFREDSSSNWEPPFLHSIDAAWLEHDTDTAKKSRASNHRRLDWSIAWVVGNCMPFVAIRKVWQNVGM